MDVTVRLPAQLRDVAEGAGSVTVTVTERATVADVLDAVAAAHPALGRRIRDERAAVRPHVNLFVGADNVRDLEGTATVLEPGQSVSVIPAVSGG